MTGSQVNACREYQSDPLVPISISVPLSLREAIDKSRREQPRVKWIADACRAYLRAEKRELETMEAIAAGKVPPCPF